MVYHQSTLAEGRADNNCGEWWENVKEPITNAEDSTVFKKCHIRGPCPPLKNHNAIGFLNNTGQDPLENHKDTKPAFIVGSS